MNQPIQISSIIVGERLRKDYGDMTDLDSIAEVGLIEPVILQKKSRRQFPDNGPVWEHNAENPWIEEFHLVAGGRRLAKLASLGFTELEHGVTSTVGKAGYLWREELNEDVALEIELYENVSRKQMDWKERILSVEKIHLIKVKRAASGEVFQNWSAEQTGRELGYKSANIKHILNVARQLRDPKSPVQEATGLLDALKLIAKSKQIEMQKKVIELSAASSLIISSDIKAEDVNADDLISRGPLQLVPKKIIPLSDILFEGKMEDVLGQMPRQSIDGIYTDWPYGIDMDNLQQANLGKDVASTAAEHDAEDNKAHFSTWLAHMYHVLKPTSFCVIWCDLDHWNYMKNLAEGVGFKVQRWPFHWVKTGPAQNGAAQYNQTKKVEHAMVLRMPGATLAKQIPDNYWVGTFAAGEKKIGDHPFMKPRALHERVLSDFFPKGSTILDPFAGGGSIPEACVANSYSPMAVESNHDHFLHLIHNMKAIYSRLLLNNVEFK